MTTDYHRRLQPVIRYLEQHYRDPPDLTTIAALASLSPYHFHRIFTAVTGETLAAYLRRLRLENIARQLFYGKADITTLALEHGYASSQALAKAFRAHFGITASELRSCQDFASYRRALQNSKIGHGLRKNGHAAASTAAYTAREPKQESNMTTLHTEQFAPRTLAYIRVTGAYGVGYEEATGRLYQWAGAHGLADGECIFIYLDHPEVTPVERCRTDICLSVPPDTAVSGGIEKQTLPGGSYAVIRRTVTEPAQYAQYWQELMTAVVDAKLEVDDRPCFEYYHSFKPQPYAADVSFYVAVVL